MIQHAHIGDTTRPLQRHNTLTAETQHATAETQHATAETQHAAAETQHSNSRDTTRPLQTQHVDIEYRSYMYSVNTYETLVKFCMMIFRLYALLERLYYRVKSSLLALVRYRNSGSFSV